VNSDHLHRCLDVGHRRTLVGLLAVIGSCAVGFLAAWDVRLSGGMFAVAAVTAWVFLSITFPRSALIATLGFVLIAGTKFRLRDPAASLGSAVDTQIVFELLVYGLIAVTIAIVWWLRKSRVPWGGTLNGWGLVAFASLAAFSTAWSATPPLTAVRAIQLIVLTMLARMLTSRLTLPECAQALRGAIVVYVCVAAALAFTFSWAEGSLEEPGFVRFSWFAVHPVTAGTDAGMACLLSLSAAVFGRGRGVFNRMALWGSVVVLALVLALTHSRGPLLAFVAGVGALGVARLRPHPRGLILAAVLIAVGALAVSTELEPWLTHLEDSDTVFASQLMRGQTSEQFMSLTGRTELWTAAADVAREHWVIGLGYQASRSALLNIYTWAGYAHNAFLQTVLDLGLVGGLLLWPPLLRGLVAAGRSAWSDDPVRRATAATLFALSVFLVANALTSESFAAAPGFELLLVFSVAFSADEHRPAAGRTTAVVGKCRT
jgi:O-antigen ligase